LPAISDLEGNGSSLIIVTILAIVILSLAETAIFSSVLWSWKYLDTPIIITSDIIIIMVIVMSGFLHDELIEASSIVIRTSGELFQ